jgi:hypothetical protein
VGNRESRFNIRLAERAWIGVRIKRDVAKELDWAVVLIVMHQGRRQQVCLYDNAHGHPERHRYRDGVKLAGKPIALYGSVRGDIPAAIEEIKGEWEGMVERWES